LTTSLLRPEATATDEALVSFFFETTSPEGVLFFLGSPSADYLSLTLVAGQLRLYGELGTGLATLTAGSGLGDGQVHRVDMQFVNGVLALAVDEQPPRVVQIPTAAGGASPTLEVAGTPVVLGSAPTFAGLALPGFSGCISGPLINGLDLYGGVGVASAVQVAACEDS
jgi:hypothetical protein